MGTAGFEPATPSV